MTEDAAVTATTATTTGQALAPAINADGRTFSPPLTPRTKRRRELQIYFDAACDWNKCRRVSSPRAPRYVHVPDRAMPAEHAHLYAPWRIYRVPLAALDPAVAYAWRSFEVFC